MAGPALNHSALVNASGFLAEDDVEDLGFSELQTVAVACVATLVPLGLALFSVFGLRMVWQQWRRDVEDGTLRRADSSDPNKSSHLLLPDEIKTSESQFSVIPAEELEEVMTNYTSAAGGNSGNHNHTSHKTTANGSIITMTMKNNHLIVETEERVLVSNATGQCTSSDQLVPEAAAAAGVVAGAVAAAGPEEAMVHRAQEGSYTGLSQSDLSLSSSGSNPAYSYGNQREYQADDRQPLNTVLPVVATRIKYVPFVVQPSQDLEDDELYLEQQHQLGNGLDELQFENPAFADSPTTNTPQPT